MPPKAQVIVPRGRPKKSAAPEPAPVAVASKKRGRAAKTQDANEVEVEITEPPRKRGRPAKRQVEEAVIFKEAPKRGRRSNVAPVEEEAPAPAPKKRMGRPPKKDTAAVGVPAGIPTEDAPAPKKRRGRPPKKETAPVDTPAAIPKKRIGRPRKADAAAAAAPKRRGREARASAAVDLSRVAGSPRISKSRSKPTSKPATAPRLNPRLRSKLRNRQPATPKVKQQAAPAPTKRRGRPPTAQAQQAAAPKQATGRKVSQKAAAKPVAPRKKRGYTTVDVPDRFAAQVQQYLQELIAADAEPTLAAEEEELVLEEEFAEPGMMVEEDEEPAMVIEEEIVAVTSTTAGADEEDVLALAEQLDGADDRHESENLDENENLNAVVTPDVETESAGSIDQDQPELATAVEVQLNIQETAQAEQYMSDRVGAIVQNVLDSADSIEPELNDKENVFDGHESRSSSDDDDETDAFPHTAMPGTTGGGLFGQGMLSL